MVSEDRTECDDLKKPHVRSDEDCEAAVETLGLQWYGSRYWPNLPSGCRHDRDGVAFGIAGIGFWNAVAEGKRYEGLRIICLNGIN